MKIAFFECKDEEIAFFKSALEEHELYFFTETLQERVTDVEEFEMISLFVHSKMSDELLDKLPHLQYVQTRSTGFDHLRCKKMYERKLVVSNVAGYAGPTVAEYAFSLLLNATRNTHIALHRSNEGEYNYADLKGIELYDKTLGIIGLGTIGLHMAKIAKGFGMHIRGYSRTKKDVFDTLDISFESLEEVLKNADILMLAVPLTPKTKGLINEENAVLLKKSAILINIARNEILSPSLYHTLPHTIACDIDQDDALLKKENILHTPHMAYYTKEALQRITEISLSNMQQFIAGEIPQNCLKQQCKKNYS